MCIRDRYQRRVRGRHRQNMDFAGIQVGPRSLSWLLVAFLSFMDVIIPPAQLPDQPLSNDGLGQSTVLASLWALTYPQQLSAVAVLSVASLPLWRACVGRDWATGRPVSAGPHTLWCVSAFLLGMSGFALRRWSKHCLAAFFTYQITVPTGLIATGPYQWWVHPGLVALVRVVSQVLLVQGMRAGLHTTSA
eukprot:TRINITY_DN2713_c0_g1_i1.p1 TRINITY_DN2713_c0_g1~~TRINITY_DN2713_c0_g1_i1.p1  ORF type:complete len:191 (-),score=20.30 TRINITY_DN2713_c0_g1_i1:409-981(-)